jgi:hypothetical protein
MGEDREDRQGVDAGLTSAGQPPAGQAPAGLAAAGLTSAGLTAGGGRTPGGLTAAGPTQAEQRVFETEVASAVRYEKGLVAKLAIALAIVAIVILMRLFFYG